MEAAGREIESRLIAAHLVYVFTELGQKSNITKEIQEASTAYYGNLPKIDAYTELLCSTLSTMKVTDMDRIVYNARNPKSRSLADWWENHQEWDKKRQKIDAKKKKEDKAKHLAKSFGKLPLKEQEQIILKHAAAKP